MASVVNCKKCGTLFLKTSNRDICDKCFDQQNKTISEMNSYVLSLQGEKVSLDALLEKFNMGRNEFESLFSAGKFVKIAQNVTFVCTECGRTVPIENKMASLCAECTRKLQNRI